MIEKNKENKDKVEKESRKKSLTEHNAAVKKEIESLEARIVKLKKSFKIETGKTQASFLECLNSSKKITSTRQATLKVETRSL